MRKHIAEPAKEVQPSVERALPAAWPHEIPKDREWANIKAYGEFGNDQFLVDVLTELHIRERQLKAALAANAAPVDWKKVVREKFPNADSRDGAIWKSEGSFTILGYSWQHAAHHPDVIGQDKWEGEDG